MTTWNTRIPLIAALLLLAASACITTDREETDLDEAVGAAEQAATSYHECPFTKEFSITQSTSATGWWYQDWAEKNLKNKLYELGKKLCADIDAQRAVFAANNDCEPCTMKNIGEPVVCEEYTDLCGYLTDKITSVYDKTTKTWIASGSVTAKGRWECNRNEDKECPYEDWGYYGSDTWDKERVESPEGTGGSCPGLLGACECKNSVCIKEMAIACSKSPGCEFKSTPGTQMSKSLLGSLMTAAVKIIAGKSILVDMLSGGSPIDTCIITCG